MSFNCRLVKLNDEAKALNSQQCNKEQYKPKKKISFKTSIKLNKNVSLPSIREFKCNKNSNDTIITTTHNNHGLIGNVSQSNISNPKASLSSIVISDNRSRNPKYNRNNSNKNNIIRTMPPIQPVKASLSSSLPIDSYHPLTKLNHINDSHYNIKLKNLKPKSKVRLMFDKIFDINQDFIVKVRQLKANKKIAMRKDFNLPTYQNRLMKIASETNISTENIRNLSEKLRTLNELVNNKGIIKKTRWQLLARQISSIAPENLIVKLNSLQSKRRRQPNESPSN